MNRIIQRFFILAFNLVLIGLVSCVTADRPESHFSDQDWKLLAPVSGEDAKNWQDESVSREEDSTKKPLPPGPIEISISQALLLALENNQAFVVERLNPQIQKTYEQEQRAAFDPSLSVQGTLSRQSVSSNETGSEISKQAEASAEVSEYFPTGTRVQLEATADHSALSDTEDENSVRLGLTATQSLLRGFGLNANLASLRQARLETVMSFYELRGFAENLVAEVENACWDYVLSLRRIEIFENSLKLAEDQLTETRERIRVGKLAGVELYAAEAEAALRREDLINARSALDLARLRLQRLLNLPAEDRWDREILIVDQVSASDVKLDEASTHVALALKWRPEINQARLELQRGDLEIVKTRNGMLPVMDLFIRMGKSGYAASFGDAAGNPDQDGYDISGGIAVEYPFFNRAARARHQRATLSRRQSQEALGNLAQLVEVDVRSALIEVRRAREQVIATAATRRLQEESLKAETEKFRVGKSTALLVASAQRDFVSSRISEIEAVISDLKAIVELHRLEGTLLERRGFAMPDQ